MNSFENAARDPVVRPEQFAPSLRATMRKETTHAADVSRQLGARGATRRCRRFHLWRLELTWYLLRCHRRLHDEPTLEDRRLCEEAIRIAALADSYAQLGQGDAARRLPALAAQDPEIAEAAGTLLQRLQPLRP
jgi:hypothetical protein